MPIRFLNKGHTIEVKERKPPSLPDQWGLTPAQRRVLVAIAELRVELDTCPTFQQVADRANVRSKHDIHDRIWRLQRNGFVSLERSTQHTLQPTELGWRLSGVDSNGLADPRVDGGMRCPRCAGVMFKPHKAETCRQLITGQPFAQQNESAGKSETILTAAGSF